MRGPGAAVIAAACFLMACSPTPAGSASADIPQTDDLAEATPHIVIDAFGYLPDARKIAIVREPVAGFDEGQGMPAAPAYTLTRLERGPKVAATLKPIGGEIDAASGDRVWYLDFSAETRPGTYVLQAGGGDFVSRPFQIGDDVYRGALRDGLRTFYYQRAGIEKRAPYASAAWQDGASHLGKGQDHEARDFFRKGDGASARDLRGGWYDAGDYNQYTNWTASYITTLLTSYAENPEAWGDDFGLPESGNGVPDVIDEALWGLDWLARMQNADGGVLSILGRATGSPPSSAKGPSYYGPASTSATLSASAAFARAALVLRASPSPKLKARAADFSARAERAWRWAEANPDVVFYNNDPRSKSEGLGAGQQEVSEDQRASKAIAAALYLFALTGKQDYAQAAEARLMASPQLANAPADLYAFELQDALLLHAPKASPALRKMLTEKYVSAPLPKDGYLSPVKDYHWGSNETKARAALLHLDRARFRSGDLARAKDEAAGYLHYLHGANPLGQLYLTSERQGLGVKNLYHGWIGSAAAKGAPPPPAFLTGGPNPGYTWDACCPNKCGSAENNQMCGTAAPSPPAGQPPLKAYADFNSDWPLNSWQVNENANNYQVAYLRLLANYVPPPG